MTTNLPMMLAQQDDWIRLVVFAIGIVIVVGGWVANQLKQIREGSAKNQRAAKHSDRSASQQRAPQLQELEYQHRDEIQAPPTAVTDQDQPANLTMAERIQRALAKAAYQQRAATLRQQQQSLPEADLLPTSGKTSQARNQADRETHRRQTLEIQQEHQRREILPREQQSQTQVRPLQKRPRPIAQLPRRDLPTSVVTDRLSHFDLTQHPVSEKSAEQTLSSQGPEVVAVAKPLHQAAQLYLNSHSMRRAIILKEIFDPPVALRDPAPSS